MSLALLLPILNLALAAPPLPSADTIGGERHYSGAARELAVDLPRVEAVEVEVDGELSEAVWAEAAVLTQFTQAEPVEGREATEETSVLVFYTPSALYVGVRARASDPSSIRATLADRDNIGRDDRVELLLDTFHDHRRAYSLSVNPLGIQQDGIVAEGGGGRGGGGADLKPDFLFDSRGRLTGEGYVVELRIPFKSLKFPSTDVQTWGINVIRRIAASGAEEAWAPISRDDPSRLAQSGTLEGIRELRPGTLFELNPVLTGKRVGQVEDDVFVHDDFEPDFGMNLKYGLTSNLTLDATYNPDFSQVEADAGQITTNERFAISYPEKRPFFLEGADIFSTPEELVYTRSIIDPIAGAKLTGKVGDLTVGYLGALDESPLDASNPGNAPSPSRALFNIARVRRDVGDGSAIGALLTDREASGQYNRVAAIDGRIRFRTLYTWEFQLAQSWTGGWEEDDLGRDTALVDGEPVAVSPYERSGHLLQTAVDRTGRNWGFRVQMKDIPDAFRARSGFIRRTGVTDFFYTARYTLFGPPGGLLENVRSSVRGNRIFDGRDFWRGEGAVEGEINLSTDFNLRGNTSFDLSYTDQFYVLDPDRYEDYSYVDAGGVQRTGAEVTAPLREMRGLSALSLGVRSSYFKTVSLNGNLSWRETPIFAEGTPGEEWSARGELQLRPTDALRTEANLRYSRIYRALDGSLYSEALLPRLKLEYQLSRAVFVRAVGEYSVEEVDLLRAPDGSPYLDEDGEPFRVRRGDRWGVDEVQRNPLSAQLLFSYQPSPGTVVFLGYGREMSDAGAYRFSPLEPRADGLFLKLSYLFRS